jgi:hypothetical protein
MTGHQHGGPMGPHGPETQNGHENSKFDGYGRYLFLIYI